MAPTTTTADSLPFIYRFSFLWVEPFLALSGALQCHFTPQDFLNIVSSNTTFTPAAQVLGSHLAAEYVYVAWTQAVLLRSTSDLRVWKSQNLGMLICVALHLWAACPAVGVEVFWRPWLWRVEEWMNLAVCWINLGIRVAFWLGWGIKGAEGKDK